MYQELVTQVLGGYLSPALTLKILTLWLKKTPGFSFNERVAGVVLITERLPVLYDQSFHLNSKQGGYIVLVSTEKYLSSGW